METPEVKTTAEGQTQHAATTDNASNPNVTVDKSDEPGKDDTGLTDNSKTGDNGEESEAAKKDTAGAKPPKASNLCLSNNKL